MRWRFIVVSWIMFSAALSALAQRSSGIQWWRSGDLYEKLYVPRAWSVMGTYTCPSVEADFPPQKFFLLPNGTWDVAAPFTPGSVHAQRIAMQTRGWHGRLLSFKPMGTFTVEAGTVRLYNTELVENSYGAHIGPAEGGLLRGLIKGLERPSVLPSASSSFIWARLLVRTFQFEERHEQLVEVLPAGTPRVPLRCRRQPLFAPENR